MGRLFLSFTIILLIALGAVWLADNPGHVVIDWLNYEVEMPVALTLVLIFIITGLTYALMRALFWALGSMAAIGSFMRERRERRARRALTRGLVALATGDVDTAQRVVRDAERVKGDEGLLLLLQAQTADQAGAQAEAERSYRAMLEHSDTELVGLLGLARVLRERGDDKSAIEYAERAVKLQPSNKMAFQSAFDIYSATGQWSDARNLTEGAMRSKAIAKASGQRRLAAAHLAEGLVKRVAGENQAALQFAQKALSLVSDFAPAAIVAADLLRTMGKPSRAGSVIESAWVHCPHPDLGRIYAQLEARESAVQRFVRVSGLTGRNRDHMESRILFARYAIAAKKFPEARDILNDLASGQPTARVAELMAKIEELEHRNTKVAEAWLGKAAIAPRDALWLCRSCGHQAVNWSPTCSQCSQFDSYYWKAAGDPDLLADEVGEPDAPHLPYEGADLGPVAANDALDFAPEEGVETQGLPRQPDDPGLGGGPSASTYKS